MNPVVIVTWLGAAWGFALGVDESTAGGVAALVLTATVAVMVATARRPGGRRLAAARVAAVIAAAGLLGLSLAGWMPRWGIVLSSLAFLAAVQAIALELGHADTLRRYLQAGEPVWWPEFERRLRRYERRRRRDRPGAADDDVPR